MEWKYVKMIKSENLIDEFEKLASFKFPKAFRECVMQNNGGRPALRMFDTNRQKERELKSFLSFNKDDVETVWKIWDWNKEDLRGKYIPFAIDNFGNLICFDKLNGSVLFVNHEIETVETIADSFDGFVQKLYD